MTTAEGDARAVAGDVHSDSTVAVVAAERSNACVHGDGSKADVESQDGGGGEGGERRHGEFWGVVEELAESWSLQSTLQPSYTCASIVLRLICSELFKQPMPRLVAATFALVRLNGAPPQ